MIIVTVGLACQVELPVARAAEGTPEPESWYIMVDSC